MIKKTFRRCLSITCLLISLLLLGQNVFAQAPQDEDEENLVQARMLAIKEGSPSRGYQDVTIGVHLQIKHGWHIYWRNSGESGMPTKVQWVLPVDSSVDQLLWPSPYLFKERGDIHTFGYENEVTLLSEASVPVSSEDAVLKAEVRWLVCKDICIPGSASLERTLSEAPRSDERGLLENAKALLPILNPKSKISPYVFIKNSEQVSVVYFILGNVKTDVAQPEESIQLYPHKSEDVIFGRPEIIALGSKFAQVGSLAIRVPLTAINADTPIEELKLSGVLSVAAPLAASGTAEHFTWNATSNPQYPATKTLLFKVLDSSPWENPATPEFRVIEHKEVAKTINLQPQASIPLYLAIIYGFIGGIILNLMPCVLPIISIKVMSFIGGAEKTRNDAIASSMAFSAGIIASFLVLASVVTMLRSLGYELGWGFQFQHPEFVFALAVIIFLLALGFFDLYSFSMPFMLEANKRTAQISSGKIKDFFDGVLATALSTPCSAPFLGIALVVAFTQGPMATYAIFMSIGFGLALPYAYLASHPKLLNKLPQPGPWMYRLRQFMGFLLLATVIWLLFVLGNLKEDAQLWAQGSLLSIFFMFWLLDWKKEGEKSLLKSISLLLGLLLCLLVFTKSLMFIASEKTSSLGELEWQDFSPERVSSLVAEGHTVFIDFTADWCVTCKANELYTITSKAVVQGMIENNVVPLKADWTAADPVVTEALNRYGAKGVPHYVVLSSSETIVLSNLPTADNLIEAFEKARMGSDSGKS